MASSTTTPVDNALDLKGLRALVTGASKGIGAAIARHLAAAGAQLVVAARAPNDNTSIGHFIRADLSTPEGPAELASATLQTLGGVDILVDNVASQTRVPDGVLAITDADWLQDLSGTLLSAVRLDRALLPDMIAPAQRGDHPHRVQRCTVAPARRARLREREGRTGHLQ